MVIRPFTRKKQEDPSDPQSIEVDDVYLPPREEMINKNTEDRRSVDANYFNPKSNTKQQDSQFKPLSPIAPAYPQQVQQQVSAPPQEPKVYDVRDLAKKAVAWIEGGKNIEGETEEFLTYFLGYSSCGYTNLIEILSKKAQELIMQRDYDADRMKNARRSI